MGVSNYCEQRVAGRDLQGQRQLLCGGDFDQFKSPGNEVHAWESALWDRAADSEYLGASGGDV